MGDGSSRRHAGVHTARRLGTLALTTCLFVACSAGEPGEREAGGEATRSPSSPASGEDPTQPRPTQTGTGGAAPRLPDAPSTEDPAALAAQLDRALATLQDPDAREVDVRRAGEFQQLAVRTLATEPPSFRRRVTSRLDGENARLTTPLITAARQLHGLTSPEQQLPRWRIVDPPRPGQLLGHYRAAQRRTGVPWTYLAAIHLVETRMGRIRGTSSAGARGPMQFIPPTWERYGAGGDINDFRDSILAAARLLKDHGAPADMAGALWHYNPSDRYVRAVSAHARTMQRSSHLYRGYWHWRVLYRHERGTYVLPVGYPDARPTLLPDS